MVIFEACHRKISYPPYTIWFYQQEMLTLFFLMQLRDCILKNIKSKELKYFSSRFCLWYLQPFFQVFKSPIVFLKIHTILKF